jgi:hypothetical protein
LFLLVGFDACLPTLFDTNTLLDPQIDLFRNLTLYLFTDQKEEPFHHTPTQRIERKMADENIMSLIQNLLLDDNGFGHSNGSVNGSVSQLDPLTSSSSTSSGGYLYGESFLAGLHHSSSSNVVNASSHANVAMSGSSLMHHNQKELMLKSLQNTPKSSISSGQSIGMCNVMPCNGVKPLSSQTATTLNSFCSSYADLATPSSVGMTMDHGPGSFFGKSYSARSSGASHSQSSSGAHNGHPMHKKSHENGLLSKDLPLSPLSEGSLNSLLGAQSNAMANQSLSALTPQTSSNGAANFASFGVAPANSFGSLQAATGQAGNLMNSWQNQNSLSLQQNSFADLLLGCSDSSSATAAAAAAAAANNAGQFGAGSVGNMYGSVNHNGMNNNDAFVSKSQPLNNQSSMAAMFTQMPHNSPSPDSFVYTEEDRFEAQMRSTANEIHSTIGLHMNGLQMRREALLQQLEHIKKIYRDVLRKQKIPINGPVQAPIGTIGVTMCNGSSQSNGNYNNKALLQNKVDIGKFPLPSISFTKPDTALYKDISSLGHLNTPAFAPFCSATGDGLEFAVPGVNCGFTIETRNCFNDELRVGRELISVEIIALFADSKDAHCHSPIAHGNQSGDTGSSNGSPCSTGSGKCKKGSLLEYTSKSIVPHTFFDHNSGKYSVTYVIPMLQHLPSELVIAISVNGLAINESPIRVPVQMHTRQNWKRVSTFGTEGNSVGELCRPWGVAVVRMPAQLLSASSRCSMNSSPPGSMSSINDNGSTSGLHSPLAFKNAQNNAASNAIAIRSSMQMTGPQSTSVPNHYLIGVADRSNNRIQMLDYDCKTQQIQVINVFGSGPGNRPGMFDRPAGICINLGKFRSLWKSICFFLCVADINSFLVLLSSARVWSDRLGTCDCCRQGQSSHSSVQSDRTIFVQVWRERQSRRSVLLSVGH